MSVLRGSYNHRSFLTLPALSALKNEDRGTSTSLRSNISQLKLNRLVQEQKWEKLESFDLEELRDGYFDPVFTAHESMFADDVAPVTSSSNEKKWLKLLNIKNLRKEWRHILKYWVAFFISIVICLIEPAGQWIGQEFRYFLPVAVLLHHPARNIGIQLEISIQSILGAATGMAYAALVWYVSTATLPAANNQGGILFFGQFLAIILTDWVRTLFQRSFYFATSCGVATLFFCSSSLKMSKSELEWKLFWDFGISYLYGIILSLLVCATLFPETGHSTVAKTFINCTESIKNVLVSMINIDTFTDHKSLRNSKRLLVESINIDLSETIREFSSQIALTTFADSYLKELRNVITSTASLLRVIPLRTELFTEQDLKAYLDARYYRNAQAKHNLSSEYEADFSAHQSSSSIPISAHKNTSPEINSNFYATVLRGRFSKLTFELLQELILSLEHMQQCLLLSTNLNVHKKENMVAVKRCLSLENRIRRKIYKLDVKYKEFITTDLFSKELLQDPKSIDIFLFLRYLRQFAKAMLLTLEKTAALMENLHLRISLPNYPLKRALRRLPSQCSIDQGANTVFHYFETKRDVDDAFEKIYNAYTSKHKYDPEKKNRLEPHTRAVDHNDFNFHTTKNPFRYRLWLLSSKIIGPENKSSFKLAFFVTFLSLPSWLPISYQWYQLYHCWWCPLILYMLANRRNVGTWNGLLRRFLYGFTGITWGFCGNIARHNNPFVIAAFAGLFGIPLAIDFHANKNTKSTYSALLCFVVISLGPYSKGNPNLSTEILWKYCWVTGLSLLIGISISIPINWIMWSFRTRTELRVAISSLLSHLSQSYQSVTDRYLYRDVNDNPTNLSLHLSNIREVRLYQSIVAVSDLLERAKYEPRYISNFNPKLYEILIERCKVLLEKIIEARISGQYFEVWESDADEEITRALLSLRRDSVSSAIFAFFVISNCFRSKNKIPKYLPSPILSRKRLYDFIAAFEKMKKITLSKRNSSAELSLVTPEPSYEKDIDKSHWTEIHGLAFARAYTEFTLQLNATIKLSKEILGEE